MRFNLYCKWGISGGVYLLTSVVFAAPSTQIQTLRPATGVEVSRPFTSVAVRQQDSVVGVNKPTTDLSVTRQKTSVSVRKNETLNVGGKPETSVAVNKQVTTVEVDKPTTNVQVMHYNEPDWQTATEGYYTTTFGSRDVSPATRSEESKPSMMSTYQAPQAKELKAAQLVAGEEGLGGNVDEAEKAAAAAALKIPKGEEASFENVMKSSKNADNIKQSVEKKMK